MQTRREIVASGALTLAWTACGCPCSAHAEIRLEGGCGIDQENAKDLMGRPSSLEFAYASKNEGPRLYQHSDDHDFDQALAHTLARLAETLHVLPAFVYFDDAKQPNAFATDQKLTRNNADGTVLFGLKFKSLLLGLKEAPDAAIASICAHEFSHILQYKLGLKARLMAGQKTVRRMELHADFLAGYFAGLSRARQPQYPAAVYATTLHLLGDNEVDAPQHHGKPAERAAAIVKGFEAAYRDKRPLNDAIELGMRYILST